MQGKRSVLVVDAENKAQFREINATSRSGNDWIVESGLQPGELVIIEGTGKSRPGSPVKPTVVSGPAATTPDAAKGGDAAKGEAKKADDKAGEPAKAEVKADGKSDAAPAKAADK